MNPILIRIVYKNFLKKSWYDLVGARGFEPPTSCSQSKRATRLRYAPIREKQTLFYHTGFFKKGLGAIFNLT